MTGTQEGGSVQDPTQQNDAWASVVDMSPPGDRHKGDYYGMKQELSFLGRVGFFSRTARQREKDGVRLTLTRRITCLEGYLRSLRTRDRWFEQPDIENLEETARLFLSGARETLIHLKDGQGA